MENSFSTRARKLHFRKHKNSFLLGEYKKSFLLKKYKNFFNIWTWKFHFWKYKEFSWVDFFSIWGMGWEVQGSVLQKYDKVPFFWNIAKTFLWRIIRIVLIYQQESSISWNKRNFCSGRIFFHFWIWDGNCARYLYILLPLYAFEIKFTEWIA